MLNNYNATPIGLQVQFFSFGDPDALPCPRVWPRREKTILLKSDECIKNGWVEEVVGRRGGYLLCLETDLDAPSQHFSWSTFFIEYNPLTVKGWKIPHLLDGISVSDLTGILVNCFAYVRMFSYTSENNQYERE